MYTIYVAKGMIITTVTTVEFFASALEIVKRETKFGTADKVWIEGPDGEIYN